MPPNRQHEIFLSYSHRDTEVMLRVREYFHTEGLRVWTDERLEPGTSLWSRSIQDAIDATGVLVVLLSPDAKQSEWVGKEIHYALQQKRRVFPILIRGDESESFPFELSGYQYVSIQNNNQYNAEMRRLLLTICSHLGIKPKLEARESVNRHLERVTAEAETASWAEIRHWLDEAERDAGSHKDLVEIVWQAHQKVSADRKEKVETLFKEAQRKTSLMPLPESEIAAILTEAVRLAVDSKVAQDRRTEIENLVKSQKRQVKKQDTLSRTQQVTASLARLETIQADAPWAEIEAVLAEAKRAAGDIRALIDKVNTAENDVRSRRKQRIEDLFAAAESYVQPDSLNLAQAEDNLRIIEHLAFNSKGIEQQKTKIVRTIAARMKEKDQIAAAISSLSDIEKQLNANPPALDKVSALITAVKNFQASLPAAERKRLVALEEKYNELWKKTEGDAAHQQARRLMGEIDKLLPSSQNYIRKSDLDKAHELLKEAEALPLNASTVGRIEQLRNTYKMRRAKNLMAQASRWLLERPPNPAQALYLLNKADQFLDGQIDKYPDLKNERQHIKWHIKDAENTVRRWGWIFSTLYWLPFIAILGAQIINVAPDSPSQEGRIAEVVALMILLIAWIKTASWVVATKYDNYMSLWMTFFAEGISGFLAANALFWHFQQPTVFHLVLGLSLMVTYCAMPVVFTDNPSDSSDDHSKSIPNSAQLAGEFTVISWAILLISFAGVAAGFVPNFSPLPVIGVVVGVFIVTVIIGFVLLIISFAAQASKLGVLLVIVGNILIIWLYYLGGWQMLSK